MSDYLRTLLRQTNSFDLMEDMDAEEAELAKADELASQRWAREKKIEALINTAFDKMGVMLSDKRRPVMYDEEGGRDAMVTCNDTVTLEQLNHLAALGSSITVHATHEGNLIIEFIVDPAMDDATIS
jgi:hypothetical protein